jgi:mono/diheme cytochrome c family protein
MKTRLFLLFIASAVATVAGVRAGEVSITLPPETAQLKPAAGVEAAQANCMICHSVDYVQSQPPMPRKFWEGEVKKMQQKYGAPVPDEKIAALVDYLVAAYGAPATGK